MSDTINLLDMYKIMQEKMKADSELSSFINHPGDKGDNTEINWIKWFEKLPRRYKAAKATIIDCEGNISQQIDIVIFDVQYSYLMFEKDGILYLPAESVYAVFEVKPEINKNYLEYAAEKAESVRVLKRTSVPIVHAGGKYPPKIPHHIISGFLANRTGWSPMVGTPLKNCLKSLKDDKQIDCGCVLNADSFFYDYSNNTLSTASEGQSLIFFFFQLLLKLQSIGTVPAIDLNAYTKVLSIKKEII